MRSAAIRASSTEPAPSSVLHKFPAAPRVLASFAPLVVLLAAFLLVQAVLPLGSAIKIGADEGFELSKPILCLHGYKLYTDVWDDQPPLYTFLITQLLKHVSPSVAVPRLLTVVFSLLLLSSFYLLILRLNGSRAASIGTALLIASPGFIELSCSCMQEVPALAPVVAALCFETWKIAGCRDLTSFDR